MQIYFNLVESEAVFLKMTKDKGEEVNILLKHVEKKLNNNNVVIVMGVTRRVQRLSYVIYFAANWRRHLCSMPNFSLCVEAEK